jgi:excinuclease UvrABC ATPase subunit
MSDDSSFDMELPDIPLPGQEINTDIEDSIPAGFKFCFVGAGQGGSRIAETFHKIGYKRVCVINTAQQDLASIDVANKLKPLSDVGLGYIKLGQSSNTLSGGEAQRVKLASFLGKGKGHQDKILFIFDEPTTGLHFHDIKKLLKSFNALIDQGHSIIVIEHNIDVIQSADWVIELGPEAGDEGGKLVYAGNPQKMRQSKSSRTARFLKA